MGEVYLGEHVDLRRPAVIKLIKAKYAHEEQVAGRMRREARIVARIRHPALVTIYDLGTAADGRTFIAMEWLEGLVLRRILQQRAPLQLDEAARLMAMTCDGLDVAHQEGVIHRDVKPENLFVTAEGQLKVLDFGVAKPMNDGDMTTARTAAGMVLGTPRYMAPEQATGRALSPATDVYAVGCVLFEMLTGTPLFDAPDARDLLWHHMKSPPQSLSQRTGRAFDPRVEQIVARALEKDPARRFGRAAEMAAALRALERPLSLPPAPAVVRASAPPEKPTVRFDDLPTSVGQVDSHLVAQSQPADDVHAKPTIRVEPSVRITPADATSAAVSAAGALDDTRAIPAQALVDGVSSTERSPIVGATTVIPSGASSVAGHLRTVPTEVLADPGPVATGSLAAEVSTSPIERRTAPVWPFVVAGLAVLGAATAGIVVLRDRGGDQAAPIAQKPTPSAEPLATAAHAHAPPPPPASAEPEPVASAPVVPAPPPDPIPAPTASAKTAPSAPTLAAKETKKPDPVVAAAKPTEPAPASAYDKAKAHVHDGDLDAAEREARAAIATHGNAARLLLGEILERKGKPALAREQYKKILETAPDHGVAKTRLAKLGG